MSTTQLSSSSIFLCGLFIITTILLVCYFRQEKQHQRELQKIIRYEQQQQQEQQKLEQIRLLTTPCGTPNLMSPRSCYFDSGYQCSWNFNAKRCDAK